MEQEQLREQEGSAPNQVRALRMGRLMTQADLARRARVSIRTVHNVERGLQCRVDTMRKVLRGLGIPFAERQRVFPPQAPRPAQPRRRAARVARPELGAVEALAGP